ncbi:MAG: hypothetical protein AAF721_04540 [Myxococcota bacterium]
MKILHISLVALLFPACVVESDTARDTGVAADAERGGLGKADLIGSCEPDDCGGPASTGTCWCDAACVDYGDCCSDKEAVCDAPCQLEDCGEAPVFVHCADGVTIAAADTCGELDDGSCGWSAACQEPPAECTPAECGEQPIFIHCADGFTIASADVCTTLEDGNCGWTAECAMVEPGECTPSECGENPGFVECPGEEFLAIADECTHDADGACGWGSTHCG